MFLLWPVAGWKSTSRCSIVPGRYPCRILDSIWRLVHRLGGLDRCPSGGGCRLARYFGVGTLRIRRIMDGVRFRQSGRKRPLLHPRRINLVYHNWKTIVGPLRLASGRLKGRAGVRFRPMVGLHSIHPFASRGLFDGRVPRRQAGVTRSYGRHRGNTQAVTNGSGRAAAGTLGRRSIRRDDGVGRGRPGDPPFFS